MPAKKYTSRELSQALEPSASNITTIFDATSTLAGHLKEKGITYAFIGDFALKLLGHSRVPAQVACAVDGKLTEVYKQLETVGGYVTACDRRIGLEGLTKVYADCGYLNPIRSPVS